MTAFIPENEPHIQPTVKDFLQNTPTLTDEQLTQASEDLRNSTTIPVLPEGTKVEFQSIGQPEDVVEEVAANE